jgi:glycogen debranching enzyme
LQVARGLFDAAARFTNHRLPELFAGLTRDEPAFPVQYLGANVPQAWAAGAVVHLVTALLGLEADAPGRKLLLRPCLPDWLTSVSMTNLGVGGAAVDLTVSRDGDGEVSLDCVCRHGKVEVDFA